MLSSMEADALVGQSPLMFSFTTDSKSTHWTWTSFRGAVEQLIQGWVSAYCLGACDSANEVAYPACKIKREMIRDGVYEAYFNAEQIMLFMWTVPTYCDEFGCPLRRGVLVLPKDRKTILSVGLAYRERLLYL